MIVLDDLHVQNYVDGLSKRFIKQNCEALKYTEFLETFTDRLYKENKDRYPMEVRLPKSIGHLMKGDNTPGKIIKLKEPPKLLGKYPIWMDDTDEAIMLDYGFENADNRFLSKFGLGLTGQVHAILGGETGSGKSVAVNNLLFNAFVRYPPWELECWMSDAKIVEFKEYSKFLIPHIRAIAAAEDQSYAISMLHHLVELMNQRNKFFGNFNGAKKISEFRKYSGLHLPRILVALEEFQSMILQAGRKEAQINKDLDLFGKLGRNTGVHEFMISQSLQNGVPKAVQEQAKLRMALKCSAATSSAVLNNDGAKNITKLGILYANANIDQANPLDNVMYRVPYQSPEEMALYAQGLTDCGKEIGYPVNLDFYDEVLAYTKAKHMELLDKAPKTRRLIYLGPSAYYKETDIKAETIVVGEDDCENFLITSPVQKGIRRILEPIIENFNRFSPKEVNYTVLTCDTKISDHINFRKGAEQVRSKDDEAVRNALYQAGRFRLLIEADKKAFNELKTDSRSEEICDRIAKKSPLLREDMKKNINRSRVYYALQIMDTDVTFEQALDTKTKDDNLRFMHIMAMLAFAHTYLSEGQMATEESLPYTYIIFVGFEKLTGLGRGAKYQDSNRFKLLLQDGTLSNVRYILTLRNPEGFSDIKPAFKYCLGDSLNPATATKFGFDDFSGDLNSNLNLLYDRVELEERRFIKYVLREEEI